MGRLAIAGIMILLMIFLLAGTGFASYRGVGISGDDTYSVRSGSTNGIFILGGGPGSGK